MTKQHILRVVKFPRPTDDISVHPSENLFLFISSRTMSVAELTEKDTFIFQDYPHHSVNKSQNNIFGNH